MTWWAVYLIAALYCAHIDAMLCLALQRRYNLPMSLVCSLAWPLFVPMTLLAVWYFTRKCPRPSADWHDPKKGTPV